MKEKFETEKFAYVSLIYGEQKKCLEYVEASKWNRYVMGALALGFSLEACLLNSLVFLEIKLHVIQ